MTTDTPAAAPITAEREAFEKAMRDIGVEPALWLPTNPEAGYANSRVADYWFGWNLHAALSAPVAAQPAASGVDAMRLAMDALDYALPMAEEEWPHSSRWDTCGGRAIKQMRAAREALSTALTVTDGGNG